MYLIGSKSVIVDNFNLLFDYLFSCSLFSSLEEIE